MRVLSLLAVALLTAACATVPLAAPGAVGAGAAIPGFSLAADTFAFSNEIRARNPARDDLYANYCFVMARAVRQFFRFARFDPAAPRLARAEYVLRVSAIVGRAPWEPALPPAARVVISGYANLREFSRAEEAAVKEGLGGRFWTLVHWSNWRVTLPVTGGHQASVAQEAIDEIRAGRLVQFLVTNWPKPELNHTVVAYAYREAGGDVEFQVWDPNDPSSPGTLVFRRDLGRFWASRLYDTEPGPIRAFRMYYSWLL